MREDIHPSGRGPALAGLLPAMQGKVPAGGNDHEDLSPLWTALHIPLVRQAMAQILPNLPLREIEVLTGGTGAQQRRQSVGIVPGVIEMPWRQIVAATGR